MPVGTAREGFVEEEEMEAGWIGLGGGYYWEGGQNISKGISREYIYRCGARQSLLGL